MICIEPQTAFKQANTSQSLAMFGCHTLEGTHVAFPVFHVFSVNFEIIILVLSFQMNCFLDPAQYQFSLCNKQTYTGCSHKSYASWVVLLQTLSPFRFKTGWQLTVPHLSRKMDMINRSGTDQVMTQTFNKRKLSSCWSMSICKDFLPPRSLGYYLKSRSLCASRLLLKGAVMQWCFTQWAPMPENSSCLSCAFLISFLLAWDCLVSRRNYWCWRCHLPWLQPSKTFLWIHSHWNTQFAFEFQIVRMSGETEQSNAPMTGEPLLQSTQSAPLAKTNRLPCQGGAGRYWQPQWANARISGVKPCSVSSKVPARDSRAGCAGSCNR